MRILTTITVATWMMASVAAGQPKPMDGTAMALDEGTPKPTQEIKEMLKGASGTWKCTGNTRPSAPYMDTIVPMKATMTTKADLDGFWVQDAFEATIGKWKYKFVAFTTYDEAAKKWRRMMADNRGTQMIGTSDGLKDGKLTFNLDQVNWRGVASLFKDSIDMTDPKVIKASGTMSIDKGKTWLPVYEMTCKK